MTAARSHGALGFDGDVIVGGSRLPVLCVGSNRARTDPLASRGPLTDGGVLIGYARERFIHLHSGSDGAACEIAWLDRRGRVVGLSVLHEGEGGGKTSLSPAMYALVAPPAWLRAAGVRVGGVLDLPREMDHSPEPMPQVVVGGRDLHVELAITPTERARGLMWRRRLSSDEGMLFVYTDDREHSYWMHNCYIPLDIAFFDAGGRLVRVALSPAYSDPRDTAPTVGSGAPARFGLEVNIGWFREQALVDARYEAQREITLVLDPLARLLIDDADV